MSLETTSLHTELEAFKSQFQAQAPQDVQALMANATQALQDSGLADRALNVGQTLPDAELINAKGDTVQLSDLLKSGPLVVTFYRGGWCPYCNLELRAYQQHLAEIRDAGATLVAITPELPDASLSTSEKNELAFEVLSDVNSAYAKQLNLVFDLPEELRPIYKSFGIDVEAHNGDGQFALPLAATYVVGSDGNVASAFIDADYTKRQEPSEVVAALKRLVTS
ncbi:peroxiredoxin-like family protein [Corallincola platygyrae]|uniref:thioredoxin-dependent peroxiredoxin n=1 Tax=Corallincola platygyrae TaxID=1193278 RepID=A0ABW4XQ12_9GAMM